MKIPAMDQALELARRGAGCTSPNPAVGAVLVKGNQVIGRGFHTYAQRKHAEVLALDQAGENARDGSHSTSRWSHARITVERRRAQMRW